VTLSRQVRSCEIRKALNIESLLGIGEPQLRWFSHVSRIPRKDWPGKSYRLHPRERGPEVDQGPGDYISDLARLGVESTEQPVIAVDRDAIRDFHGLLFPQLSTEE